MLWISQKIVRPNSEAIQTQTFLQRMLNRLIQGYVRYGAAKEEQRYMTRLIMEVKAYKKSGNVEQLYNIANYALLESIAPENKRFHFDASVESVTRGRI